MSNKAARIFVIIVAVGLAVTAVTFGVNLVLPATNTSSSSMPQLATASITTFPVVVSETGSVVLASETDMNFPVSGTIAAIDVKVGQTVAQGTVLANLSSSSAQNAVAQAQANLSSAESTLNAAEHPLTPSQSTSLQTILSNAEQVQNDTTSSVQQTATIDAQNVQSDQTALASTQSSYNSASCATASTSVLCQSYQSQITAEQNQLTIDQQRSQTDASAGALRNSEAQGQVNAARASLTAASTPNPAQISQAQSGVNAATSSLQSAQSALTGYTLTSPIAATVLAVNGQVGQTVPASTTATQTLPGSVTPLASVSSNGNGQSAFIVLGTPSQLIVAFAFPSSDYGLVQVGQSATITGQSTLGLSVTGKVQAIASNPVPLDGVPSYYATVFPSTSTKNLIVGLNVSVSVFVSQESSVLSVPASAIYVLGGAPHVDVWNGHIAVPTSISTGAQGVSLVQVTQGLRAGEQVELVANQGFTQAGLP